MSKSLISIVIPCLDEEENVERTYRAICDAIEKEEKYDFEFIFTDNHSSDNTFEVLRRLSAADSRIHAVRFSKNFGYQMSIFTGYMQATGDAAIQLDADLQDPPYLISEFLRRWEDGYKVVYGIRKTQKANAFLTLMTEVFYWLLDKLSESRVPHNAGECRLIDRAVIDALGPPPRDRHLHSRPDCRNRLPSDRRSIRTPESLCWRNKVPHETFTQTLGRCDRFAFNGPAPSRDFFWARHAGPVDLGQYRLFRRPLAAWAGLAGRIRDDRNPDPRPKWLQPGTSRHYGRIHRPHSPASEVATRNHHRRTNSRPCEPPQITAR